MDICRAITNVISASKLEGVQHIRNIWRIYLKDKQTRLALKVKESLTINGHRIPLYDQKPNVTFSESGVSGVSRQKKDKLTIKNLPLSVSNNEIVKMLTDNNVVLASPVRYGLIRDESGQLTTFKSGDCYVYVEPFNPPLPKQQNIGIFQCLVLCHGKMAQCQACGEAGHKIGDDRCKATSKDKISAFRGYTHPLSNHCPCEIKIFNKTFKMAVEFGKWNSQRRFVDVDMLVKQNSWEKNIADADKWICLPNWMMI